MQSWKDIVRNLDIYNLHEQLYADIGEFDVVSASNISFNDGIVSRLAGTDWYGETDIQDIYFQKSSVIVPEDIYWCDCHKHRPYQKKVTNIFETIKKGSKTIRQEQSSNFVAHRGNFAHGNPNVQELSRHQRNAEVCYNYEMDEFTYPTKWHLVVSYYESGQGNQNTMWVYPNDLIIRRPNARNELTYRHIDSICNYDIYLGFCNGEDIRPMSEDDFYQDIANNWTWDIDNPRKCHNHEICSTKTKLEDYMPDFTELKKEHIRITKQETIHKTQMLALYEVMNYPDQADEYIKELAIKEWGDNIFDEGFFYASLSLQMIHSIAKELKIPVYDKEQLDSETYKKVLNLNDIDKMLSFFDKQFSKIKAYEYQENQLKYILDNLLTLGVDDMPLLREYAETHDIR